VDAIPYGRQSVDAKDVDRVTQVLTGDWLTQGPTVTAFEEAVADLCDVPHAVAFSSGTAALHAAAFAAGTGPGDTLLTSALTFAASANCGVYLGADPAFADIDPDTLNMSAATAASAPARVVIPVDFAGLPAPIEAIRAAVGDEVALIADAAHSLGARHPDGRQVGCCDHEDLATFSFHPVKPVTSCEGGMVTTRSDERADLLRRFRSHGFAREGLRRADQGAWYHEQVDLGFNYRLSDVHSALGLSQLDRLDEFIERRNEIAQRYREGLADVESVELPPAAPPGGLHGYHLFVIRHPERRRLYDALREEGILVQVHYLPVYWHPYYMDRFGFQEGLCPEAERYYETCLSLPCFPTLTEGDQQRVIDAVKRLA
jgi:UDP-4-amino-4,6-dideoxy-N-acetyl-beta-L-altrosamine transaminase